MEKACDVDASADGDAEAMREGRQKLCDERIEPNPRESGEVGELREKRALERDKVEKRDAMVRIVVVVVGGGGVG